jgi:ABC-type antimicrobial peptide transport system permease subunit
MTYAGIVELSGERPNRNFFPITLTEGVQPDDALARLDEAVDLYTVPRQQPTDLVNFGRTEALPLIGAGLLGLVAAAMVTHLLLSSVRRRRRDLALLKTLGLTGRQVSQTVAWQASTLAVVALLVGLPLGAAAGRWAWTIAADRLGVVAEPVVPIGALIALAPLTLVVVNVVAAVPAWLAARTRPADVLRSE